MPSDKQATVINPIDYLKESEAQLSVLSANIREGMLYEYPDKGICIANKRYCDIFKIALPPGLLSNIKLNGASSQNLNMMANPENYAMRIQQLIAYRKPAAGDKLQFKDGRVVERSYFPVVIEGTLKGHLWIYNEEIDLNKLEKTVNAKIDKYRNVIANMKCKRDVLLYVGLCARRAFWQKDIRRIRK